VKLNQSICFVARDNLFSKRGGDTVLCELYANMALENGYSVSYWVSNEEHVEADLYHAFNLDRPLEIYPRLLKIKSKGKKYILTSLHHPNAWVEKYRSKAIGSSFISRLFYASPVGNTILRAETTKEYIRQILSGHPEISAIRTPWEKRVTWLITHASCICLQSKLEKNYIEEDFGISIHDDSILVLPNPAMNQTNKSEMDEIQYDILFVGRIEARKNILSLIKAVTATNKSLLVIGKPNPNESKYVREASMMIRDNPNIHWIEGVNREVLQMYYKKAKVFINPSYVEVSPIVDIEALANGCPIITTDYALHHEFLPSNTPVCDPYSIDSIIECISSPQTFISAAKSPSQSQVKDDLLSLYSVLILGD